MDFSTGSVGLGAAAPLFAAVTRRYVDAHFGARPHSRFVALIGDAELDEGNIWEAVADPATTGLGNVMWLVDFNRQSLDRVVPGIRINQWRGQFEAAGWHVVEVKYGRRLAEAYARPGGAALRDWIDAMPNEQYQSLFGLAGAGAAQAVPGRRAGRHRRVRSPTSPTTSWARSSPTWAGTTSQAMLDAYAQCDAVTDRPSVVFAYTVKGWGLPIAGNPRNHSALLTTEQVDTLRAAQGLTAETEWDRLDPASPAGIRAGARREALSRAPRERALGVTVPETTEYAPTSRSPRRRPSAGCWWTWPATRRWRPTWSPPPRTWPPPPTWPGSSTRPACSPPPSSVPGPRTGCCAGRRAPPGSTSSWASRR